jgi:DNA-binding transcriptional regulator GbsR (MarR family)
MQLSPAVEKYVLHWGEMGTRWGTNRTVAQIHALLYVSPRPLRADQICDLLSVARSNVSVYDVWELFRVIIEQRKQRELNPTLNMLRECAAEVERESGTDPVTKTRIRNMLDFVELTSNWYEEIRDIPTSTLTKLMKLGTGITKLVRPARKAAK